MKVRLISVDRQFWVARSKQILDGWVYSMPFNCQNRWYITFVWWFGGWRHALGIVGGQCRGRCIFACCWFHSIWFRLTLGYEQTSVTGQNISEWRLTWSGAWFGRLFRAMHRRGQRGKMILNWVWVEQLLYILCWCAHLHVHFHHPVHHLLQSQIYLHRMSITVALPATFMWATHCGIRLFWSHIVPPLFPDPTHHTILHPPRNLALGCTRHNTEWRP